jgi:hypothetical protein
MRVAQALVAEELLAVPQAEHTWPGRAAEAVSFGMERLRFGERPRLAGARLKYLSLDQFPLHAHKLSTAL